MCLAVPGKITALKKGGAEVDFSGVRRSISLELAPDAKKGDYVLVHAGFAIQLLDEREALETLELFREMSKADGRNSEFRIQNSEGKHGR